MNDVTVKVMSNNLKKPKTQKKISTRPVPTFPFTITQNDVDDVQKIAHGLHIVRYLVSEIPGIEIVIRKITTTEITLTYTYCDQNGIKHLDYNGYRIGFNTLRDGVLYATGRTFKSSFAEFVDDIKQKHFPIQDLDDSLSESQENESQDD